MARIVSLLCLVLVLAAAPLRAQESEEDKGWLTSLLEDSLGGEGRTVSINGFSGAFSSRATIDSITVADDEGVWLSLSGVAMEWTRSALLSGRVEIDELSAERIEMSRLPVPVDTGLPPAEAQGFSLPDLPVSVRIAQIDADRIVLGAPVLGEGAEMSLTGAMQLADGEASVKLDAQRLDDRTGRFQVDLAYSEPAQTLDVAVEVSEGEGGILTYLMKIPDRPALDLAVKGSGPLDDFTADLRLATAGAERLTGNVVLQAAETPGARRFAVDMAGDVTALFDPQYRPFFGDAVQLDLRGLRGADGGLTLERIDLDTRALTLAGSARLNPDYWPEALDIDGRIALENGDAVLLPLSDPPTRLDTAELSITYAQNGGDAFDARITISDFSRGETRIARLALEADGTMRGDVGTLGRIVAETRLTASGIALPDPALARAVGTRITGSLALDYTEDAPLQLTALELEGDGITLTGKATIADLQQALATDFETALQVDDLGRFAPLTGRDLAGAAQVSVNGSADLGGAFDLAVSGTGTDLAIGQEQADALLAGQTELTIRARRDETGTAVEQLDLANAQLSLEAAADLGSAASEMRVDARIEDSSLLSENLKGPLTLQGTAQDGADGLTLDFTATGPYGAEAHVTGRATGQAPDVTFRAALPDIGPLVPQMQGPARIEGGLTRPAEVWMLRADASAPEGITATVSGPVTGDTPRIDFDAAVPRIGAFVSGIEGALRLDGTLARLGDVWSVRTDAEGPYGLTATVAGPLTGEDAPRFDFNAALPDVSPLVPQLRGAAQVAGSLTQEGGAWVIDAEGGGPYGLTASVTGPLTGDAPRIDFAAALPDVSPLAPQFRGAAQVEGQLAQTEGVWAIDARGSGPYSLTASASGPLTGPQARLDFSARMPNVAPLVPQISGPLSVDGSASQQNGGWQLQTDISGPQGTSAQIGGTIGAGGALDIDASGNVPLGLADPFLRPRSLQGMARFDLSVDGPPALSSVSGNISTRGATFTAPILKVTLNDIATDIALSGGRATIEASATGSEGGRVSLSGPVELGGAMNADLSIALNSLRLIDPRLYDTVVNGAIDIDGALAGGALISGRIDVGETLITVPSSGLSGGGPIPDVTHVGAPADVQATRRRAGLIEDENGNGNGAGGDGGPVYRLDLLIDAPARVFVRGRGLDAEIGGSFRLTGTTQNVISSGALNLVRGRLDILDKRFDLDEGSVQLQGDFNPFVRFVATTDTDLGTASVVIEGPASEPEVRFESSPQAPEEEVLSQIFFGRDLTQLSAFQALQLANAVATLAGRGGEGIVSRLRRGFGLDDLDITTNDEGETEVRVGKYLTDNVYTDVTVGPENATDLSINLDLTPSLTARGTVGSDENTSLGIYFEKDY